MTEADLKAIEERAAKATEGPWMVGYYCHCGNPNVPEEDRRHAHGDFPYKVSQAVPHGARVCGYHHSSWDDDGGIYKREDAEFIAAARVDVPALVAEVRSVNRRLFNAQGALGGERCLYDGKRRPCGCVVCRLGMVLGVPR